VSEELDKYIKPGGSPEGFASYLRDRMAPDRQIETLAKAETANQIASTRSIYRTTYCEKVVSDAERMVEKFKKDLVWSTIEKENV